MARTANGEREDQRRRSAALDGCLPRGPVPRRALEDGSPDRTSSGPPLAESTVALPRAAAPREYLAVHLPILI